MGVESRVNPGVVPDDEALPVTGVESRVSAGVYLGWIDDIRYNWLESNDGVGTGVCAGTTTDAGTGTGNGTVTGAGSLVNAGADLNPDPGDPGAGYFVSQKEPFFRLDRTALNRNASLIVLVDCRSVICSKNFTIASRFIPRGSFKWIPRGRYFLSINAVCLSAIILNGAWRSLSADARPTSV
jgi:hypothetical protein